jgi:poly(3-hydroxyalkanoate) synthetase
MKKRHKLLKIIEDCLEELYQNSTPKGSYYELKKYAIENNIKDEASGKFKIPFEDYYINKELYSEILEKHIKKNKLKKKDLFIFNIEVNLGPSPISKY